MADPPTVHLLWESTDPDADLARSAVLLGTRYRDWTPTSETVRAAYIDAYDHHAEDPLTRAERHELDAHIAGHLQAFGWAT